MKPSKIIVLSFLQTSSSLSAHINPVLVFIISFENQKPKLPMAEDRGKKPKVSLWHHFSFQFPIWNKTYHPVAQGGEICRHHLSRTPDYSQQLHSGLNIKQ